MTGAYANLHTSFLERSKLTNIDDFEGMRLPMESPFTWDSHVSE